MSVHVLLNLLNELRKRDKMRGLSSILSLLRNEINNSNKTGSRMVDFIYHTTLKLLLIAFWLENASSCHLLHHIKMDAITVSFPKSVNH